MNAATYLETTFSNIIPIKEGGVLNKYTRVEYEFSIKSSDVALEVTIWLTVENFYTSKKTDTVGSISKYKITDKSISSKDIYDITTHAANIFINQLSKINDSDYHISDELFASFEESDPTLTDLVDRFRSQL